MPRLRPPNSSDYVHASSRNGKKTSPWSRSACSKPERNRSSSLSRRTSGRSSTITSSPTCLCLSEIPPLSSNWTGKPSPDTLDSWLSLRGPPEAPTCSPTSTVPFLNYHTPRSASSLTTPEPAYRTDISELTTGAEGAESHPAENIDNPPPRTLSDDPDVDL